MIHLAFYAFAGLSVSGALAVLFTKNVLYAAFFLLLTLLSVAALFVLASADLLAVAQLMIYVGGVLVLVIFGIMLTHRNTPVTETTDASANRVDSSNRNRSGLELVLSFLLAGGVFTALVVLLYRANFTLLQQPVGWQSTAQTIGKQLMTEYVVPFEIVGILLLAALVGATYLAFPFAKPAPHAGR